MRFRRQTGYVSGGKARDGLAVAVAIAIVLKRKGRKIGVNRRVSRMGRIDWEVGWMRSYILKGWGRRRRYVRLRLRLFGGLCALVMIENPHKILGKQDLIM